ncbi:MAG: NaMN--DMB phosphoribosyltransferase [Prochlorococcaceae cyanobacterium]
MAPPPATPANPGLRLSGTAAQAASWRERLQASPPIAAGFPLLLLLLAATETAAVEGISAAGATAASRRRTAAADAELLLLGPSGQRPHALPPLPAGVSPALISHVVAAELGLAPLVVDLGCAVAPAVPHLQLGPLAGGVGGAGAAACLSSGAAMAPARVAALVALGRRWGEAWHRRHGGAPLLLAECVPGGTSTALAVLLGLGVEAGGLVSGSLRDPAHELKAELAARGLAAAGLPGAGQAALGQVEPLAVLAAVGDPMQALAAGLVQTAAAAGVPLLLAGGSQMAAVLALALALAPADGRPELLAHAAVVTTAWVAEEPGSDLARLLGRIGARFLPAGAPAPLGLASRLRFHHCRSAALRDYERGYVKEGVGAGGLALLWELSGRSPEALAAACDQACGLLLGP